MLCSGQRCQVMHRSTSPVALTPSLTEKLCIIYGWQCKVSLAFRTPQKAYARSASRAAASRGEVYEGLSD